MKNLYILFIFTLLMSCGNSETKNEALSTESKNNDEVVITKAQFEGEQMQFGSSTKGFRSST